MCVCVCVVVRGNIRAVEVDTVQRVAVIRVSATRVYRQKWPLFSSVGRLTHSGEIRTPLHCGVRAGSGSFLFTGHAHFREAWLTCAPRYKDFLRVYEHAKQDLQIPCTLDTWAWEEQDENEDIFFMERVIQRKRENKTLNGQTVH